MIKGWLRRLVREEVEASHERLANYLADLIAENNSKIEQDLVDIGLLDRDGRGELTPNHTV